MNRGLFLWVLLLLINSSLAAQNLAANGPQNLPAVLLLPPSPSPSHSPSPSPSPSPKPSLHPKNSKPPPKRSPSPEPGRNNGTNREFRKSERGMTFEKKLGIAFLCTAVFVQMPIAAFLAWSRWRICKVVERRGRDFD